MVSSFAEDDKGHQRAHRLGAILLRGIPGMRIHPVPQLKAPRSLGKTGGARVRLANGAVGSPSSIAHNPYRPRRVHLAGNILHWAGHEPLATVHPDEVTCLHCLNDMLERGELHANV